MVTSDPAPFLRAMEELASQVPFRMAVAAPGVRLLNAALMTAEPLAQAVLAFSAVEALGQQENWSRSQKDLINRLADEVEGDGDDSDSERFEIADALRRSLHRVGLRQGVLRVLSRLGLASLKSEWDRLYSVRSGLFHGTMSLSQQELHQFANDAVKIAGKIILAVAKQEGVSAPSVSAVHFGETFG